MNGRHAGNKLAAIPGPGQRMCRVGNLPQDHRDEDRVSVDLDGAGPLRREDRHRLSRPHAGAAFAPFADRPHRARRGRHPYRPAPHDRGCRHRARPGDRQGARRPQGHHPLRLDRPSHGRGLHARRCGRVGPAASRLAGGVRAAEGRRVRHRAVPRVLSGAGAERRASRCTSSISMARTATTSPRPASRRWRACFRTAFALDPRNADAMPSTKGTLTGMSVTMRAYTVHAPPDEPAAPERFAFVKDGFSWPALFVPILWILWHRLWLTLVWLRRLRAGRRLDGRLVGDDAAIDRRHPRQPPLRARGEQHPPAVARRAAAGARSAASFGRISTRRRSRFFDKWRRREPAAAARAARGDRARRLSAGIAPRRRRRADPRPLPGAGASERRHHRLRLGQPALRRQGLRARRARDRRRDRRHLRSRGRRQAPSGSCCRASAPSPIAGAGSTPCPAWSRR